MPLSTLKIIKKSPITEYSDSSNYWELIRLEQVHTKTSRERERGRVDTKQKIIHDKLKRKLECSLTWDHPQNKNLNFQHPLNYFGEVNYDFD